MQNGIDKLSEKGTRLLFWPDAVVAMILCLGAVHLYRQTFLRHFSFS